MHRVRGKLTYANVIATLALFIALAGGTAYAASELGKESVGTKQLAKGAVTPVKLSKASKATLTGPKGATGAPGPKGDTGGQGPQGVPGPGNIVTFNFGTQDFVSTNSHGFEIPGISFAEMSEYAWQAELVGTSGTQFVPLPGPGIGAVSEYRTSIGNMGGKAILSVVRDAGPGEVDGVRLLVTKP